MKHWHKAILFDSMVFSGCLEQPTCQDLGLLCGWKLVLWQANIGYFCRFDVVYLLGPCLLGCPLLKTQDLGCFNYLNWMAIVIKNYNLSVIPVIESTA